MCTVLLSDTAKSTVKTKNSICVIAPYYQRRDVDSL